LTTTKAVQIIKAATKITKQKVSQA